MLPVHLLATLSSWHQSFKPAVTLAYACLRAFASGPQHLPLVRCGYDFYMMRRPSQATGVPLQPTITSTDSRQDDAYRTASARNDDCFTTALQKTKATRRPQYSTATFTRGSGRAKFGYCPWETAQSSTDTVFLQAAQLRLSYRARQKTKVLPCGPTSSGAVRAGRLNS